MTAGRKKYLVFISQTCRLRAHATATHKDSPSCLQCRAVIAVVRPSIGTVRNQRASLGPLDHFGPCLSLRSLVLPPCEDPLLQPHADLRGICACTAAAEVASRGRSTTLPEAVSALHCLIRDQYVTPDAPELRHVIPESILYCCRTLLLALGRCDAEERIKTWLWLLDYERQTASAPFNSATWQQFACSSANTSHASCGSLGTCSRQARACTLARCTRRRAVCRDGAVRAAQAAARGGGGRASSALGAARVFA